MNNDLINEVRLATAKACKVTYMNLWFAENARMLIGMNTAEKQAFALKYFGSKSYTTEMCYAIRQRHFITLDPEWRVQLLGARYKNML